MATATSTTQERLDATAALAERLRGEVIGEHDAGYDDARTLYNAMIDKRPRMIARCVDAGDVIAAVGYARANGLEVAVRCGAHNGAGLGSVDDGLVIDLSAMRGVRVDPERRTAEVLGGIAAGRCRPRHARLRPGGAVRDHRHHWRRRAHAGRGHRPPDPQARPVDRQPHLRGRRTGGRVVRDGQRGSTRGPVLGPARRWRQLRSRDRVHVQAQPRQHGRRGPDAVRLRALSGGPPLVPGVPPERARGAQRVLRLPHGPAGAAVPGGTAPEEGVRRGVVLRRSTGARR